MPNITIEYQNERNAVDESIHYPEDFRTPRQRVDYIKGLSESMINMDIHFVSACPYVIEAILKFFKDVKFVYLIDGKETNDINNIFKFLADPMQDLLV